MTELRILLATPYAEYEQRVREAFGHGLNGELSRWDVLPHEFCPAELLTQLQGAHPDVVAIGPDVHVDDALAFARELESKRPEISVLLVDDPSPQLWQRAVRSGVRDIVSPSAPDSDVRSAFEHAMAVATRRRETPIPEPALPQHNRRLITVLSPKGGSGKTTVASNLALGLARVHPNDVVLVDFDLQFGDVAVALGLTPERSVLDATTGAQGQDALVLKSFLTPHTSNLWALCAPPAPEDGDEVDVDSSAAMLRTLATEFQYVIVDTGAGLSEHALAAIDESTDLVLVCAMDLPTVRSLAKEVDLLNRLGMTRQRRHLVINRVHTKAVLDLDDIEEVVGLQATITIPLSRHVADSLSHGSPVLEQYPRSPAGRQLTNLLDAFTDQPVTRSRRHR